jgi:hypothetical protein
MLENSKRERTEEPFTFVRFKACDPEGQYRHF